MGHNANIRLNDPDWLIIQAKRLVDMANEHQNASSLIYACLEARLALESSDLQMILATVPEKLRPDFILASKPRHGINKLNKKVGSLKERYQLFILAIFEAVGFSTNFYDFKKSKELQGELSTYIHSYHFGSTQLQFDSHEMKVIPNLVEQVYSFIYATFYHDDGKHEIRSVDIVTLYPEDKAILDNWKVDTKMDFQDLVEQLRMNFNKRK